VREKKSKCVRESEREMERESVRERERESDISLLFSSKEYYFLA
jgi:hypothetical protein